MPEIIPAILEADRENFDKKLSALFKIPDLKQIQIDFSDGKFTEQATVPLADLDLLNPVYSWQAHLMVEDPRAYFFDAKLFGFNDVIFHFEAVADKNELQKIAEEITALKMHPILAIDAQTSAEAVLPYLQFFDEITVLTVKPGFQGGEILPESYEKIKKLRTEAKNVIIEVDGGVKIANIRQLLQAGADNFVVGSGLYEDGLEALASSFEKFQKEIRNL